MVAAMARGDSVQLGKEGVIEVIGNREAIRHCLSS